MRPVVVALTMMLVATLVPWPAQAQNAAAPDPSGSANLLYASSNDAADRTKGWLSTDQAPGSTPTVGGAVPEDCLVPGTEGQGLPPPACEWGALDWTWTYTLSPALRGPLSIDGTLRMIAYLGAGTGSGDGLQVSSQLKSGDTTLADGAAQSFTFTASATGTDYGTVTWEVPVKAALAAGATLTWTVHVVGAAGDATDNLFMGVGDTRGHSRIVLPLSVATKALTGSPAKVNFTAASATTEQHLYSWTAPAGGARIQVAGNRTGGEALVLVRDGNVTLANNTFKGTAFTKDLTGPGNWTLDVRLKDFQGDVTITLSSTSSPSGGPAGGGGSGSKSSGTNTKSGSSSKTSTSCAPANATANATSNATACGDGDGKKKGSPGVPMPVLTGAVLVAALVLARRRRND